MIDYNDVKDIIIMNNPISGEFTLKDFLDILEDFLKDQEEFEKIVKKVLIKNPQNTPLANKLMKMSSTSTIKFIIAYIKDEL